MKVRVIEHYNKTWRVEKRYWFWPFWIVVDDNWPNFDGAKCVADRLKHPTILEVA